MERTGRRTQYAVNVKHAAKMYTVFSAMENESRASRCCSGSRVRTNALLRRICRMSCTSEWIVSSAIGTSADESSTRLFCVGRVDAFPQLRFKTRLEDC